MPSTIRRARLRSLAKINLDLRVLHKNPDGFHEMRTVFHTISLADTLHVEYQSARQTKVTLDDPAGIPDNLVTRAARAALNALRTNARAHFRLAKTIPMGAGLGGGSSNAAAVLLALPALAGRTLPSETLMQLATDLGSDVPFFLLGGAAVGIGRGTELYPLADLAPEPLLIVASEVHVATGPAYAALNRDLTFPALSRSINSFEAVVWALERERSAAVVSAFSANDFEASVFRKHPQLNTIRAKLSALKSGARMTGSGSAIFALFRSVDERERAERVLSEDPVFRQCRVMRSVLVNRSSYRRMWRRQLAEHLVPDDDSWPPQSRYLHSRQ